MRRWRVKLPGGLLFEMESDEPGRELIAQGYTAFALEEIIPPPPPAESSEQPEGKPILTVRDAAELLQVSERTVYNWKHRDGFPAVKIGNSIRIPRGSLMEWFKSQA